uniref:Uncharacterized protein n=1 Tax=Arundo donax TaxID=35708 RepID=A0A0A9FKN2_ARUDO
MYTISTRRRMRCIQLLMSAHREGRYSP